MIRSPHSLSATIPQPAVGLTRHLAAFPGGRIEPPPANRVTRM